LFDATSCNIMQHHGQMRLLMWLANALTACHMSILQGGMARVGAELMTAKVMALSAAKSAM
jgi:hypothetical protein